MRSDLTSQQRNALRELIGIGIRRAAESLSILLSTSIDLEVPDIRVSTSKDNGLSQAQCSAVNMSFDGTFSGSTYLVFEIDHAAKIASLMLGESMDSPTMDAMKSGTLTELGNIVIGAVMGTLCNVLNQNLRYSLPNYIEDNVNHIVNSVMNHPDTVLVVAHTQFVIRQYQIQGDMFILFETDSYTDFVKALPVT